MTRKQQRTTMIAAAVGVLGLAVGLVLFALRDSIVFFYTPWPSRKRSGSTPR